MIQGLDVCVCVNLELRVERSGTYTVFTVRVKLIIPLLFILIIMYIAEQLGFCTDHRVAMI